MRWAGDRCSVCDSDIDFSSDQLVSCDLCGLTVHQSCYGVADLPSLDDMWLCRACELKAAPPAIQSAAWPCSRQPRFCLPGACSAHRAAQHQHALCSTSRRLANTAWLRAGRFGAPPCAGLPGSGSQGDECCPCLSTGCRRRRRALRRPSAACALSRAAH